MVTQQDLYQLRSRQQYYHQKIVDFIMWHGVMHNKKHGSWKILPYTDNHFFLLDTYNKHVSLYIYNEKKMDALDYMIGIPVKCDVVGINRSVGRPNIISIGGDWGGFWCHMDDLGLLAIYVKTLQAIYEPKPKKFDGYNAAVKYLAKTKAKGL